jgi:hypothetical protein
MINAQALKTYRARWQLVAEAEANDLQTLSLSQRWQQFNAVNGLMAALGKELEQDSASVQVVRQRWNLLKERWVCR